MSAEPETTLTWAEFLWTVTKEAPQAALLYLLLFEVLRRRWRGGDVTIRVPAAVAVASAPSPAALILSPAHGTSSTSMVLTTGKG